MGGPGNPFRDPRHTSVSSDRPMLHRIWLRNSRVRGSFGSLKNTAARSMLDDNTSVGKINMIRNLTRKAHFVRDKNTGHSFLGKFPDRDQHFLDRLRVERRGDFVEKHHIGVHRQRAGDRDRCRWPPDSPRDRRRFLFGQPHLSSADARARASPLRLDPALSTWIGAISCSPAPSGAETDCTAEKPYRSFCGKRACPGRGVTSCPSTWIEPLIDRDECIDAAQNG